MNTTTNITTATEAEAQELAVMANRLGKGLYPIQPTDEQVFLIWGITQPEHYERKQ